MKVCKKVDCIHYSNNLKCGLHDEDCQKTCFDAKIEQENEQLKQQLAEKEELLKYSYKFKRGQKVYTIVNGKIKEVIISGYKRDGFGWEYFIFVNGFKRTVFQKELFATKEEAQKKLEEMG